MHVRVSIDRIEPQIWRRLIVPLDFNLRELHLVLQAAFGWMNAHMHEFEIGGLNYGDDSAAERMDDDPRVFDEMEVTLRDFTREPGTTFRYVYDMGDNWEHHITIERVQPVEPGKLYPDFLGGERRCPPEDCGSVPGYYEFLDVIAGPDKGKGSRRKKEMLDWYGGPYDPDDIGEAQIRAALKRLANTGRRRRPTAADT